MKKLIKITCIFMFIFLFTNFSNVTYADFGNKPSITIKIKNLETTNYVIDLFENYEGRSNTGISMGKDKRVNS